MSNQFISPNWHVLLIHYPIALLSGGILIELFSFFWPRGFFRAAGRWMILLGALLSIPALAGGIYAFRATVIGPEADPHMLPWYQVMRESAWSSDQWQFMRYHVWLNCIGVGLVVIGVTAWVAASDLWRRRLYLPVLLALVCGMGAFGAGSWFGGESVYRFGTAVEVTAHAAGVTSNEAGPVEVQHGGAHPEGARDLKWYVPPIELHIVLAGLLAAIAIGALALTIRRLEWPSLAPEPAELIGAGDTEIRLPPIEEPLELVTHDNATPAVASAPGVLPSPVAVSTPVVASTPYPHPPALIYPARFWLLVFFAALCTAAAGLWSVVDVFSSTHLKHNWESLLNPAGQYRLLLHAIVGISLLLLPLILAVLARYGRRRRGFTGTFLVLTLLAIALQFWLGIAMYYDGHKGPVYRFNVPALPH